MWYFGYMSNTLQMVAAGGRLRTAMQRRGYSARILAEKTGISMPTIYHLLHGTRDIHRDDMLKIGAALGVRPGWIVWGE